MRLRWKHSDEMIGVLRLLFAAEYVVIGVELPANGGRLDILAIAPDQRKIVIESNPKGRVPGSLNTI